MSKGTGARGLRAIIEKVMLDIMFELPEQEPGLTYTVSDAVIEGREQLFELPKSKSA